MSLPNKLAPRYKKLQHPWSTSFDYESRSPRIVYYLRTHVLQEAFALDKKLGRSTNPAEQFPIVETLDYLEKMKKEGNLGTEDEAYLEFEATAAKLLAFAEKLDNSMNYDRKIIKIYFTASILFDAMSIFKKYDGRHNDKSKFVKWRSTYIANELKHGRIPEPPTQEVDRTEDELAELEAELNKLDGPGPSQPQVQPQQPPAAAPPQRPTQPKPQQFNTMPSNPYPNIGQTQNFYPPQQPVAQPQQPVAQPRQQPVAQSAQVNTGTARTLTYQEQKEVKEMLSKVQDCFKYQDFNGARQLVFNAYNFMGQQ